MPKNGIASARATSAAFIIPRVPRLPNPPGTRMPSAPASSRAPSGSSSASASTQRKFTFTPCGNPPWVMASLRLL